MGTGVDRKYARDHAAKLLDDQLAGDFQDSIYAPGMFGPSGGPFGAPSSAVKRKKDGIPRLRDMPVRVPADRFVVPTGPQPAGLGVLRVEELASPPIPRGGDKVVRAPATPLWPYQTAEEYRRNCAAIDPADENIHLIERGVWSNNANPHYEELERQKGGYDTITFHHTGKRRTAAEVEDLHLGTTFRGWGERPVRKVLNHFWPDKIQAYDDYDDIGYHFMIDRDGKVYEGRSMAFKGAHVRYHNDRNLGIAFLGDYTNAPLTTAQLQTAYNLTGAARKAYRIEKLATHGELDGVKASELKGAMPQLRCLVR